MSGRFTASAVVAATGAVFVAALAALVPGATAHEGTGQHESISGQIPAKGAWSWTVDEPVGMFYFIDESNGRQGALEVLADEGTPATHTVRILPSDGESVRLDPQTLTVRYGDKVTWVNEDDVGHVLVGSTGFHRDPVPQPSQG